MKQRFTDAITKLYNAYHKGELAKGYCTKCAVGNMCDGSGIWNNLFFSTVDEAGVTRQLKAKPGEILAAFWSLESFPINAVPRGEQLLLKSEEVCAKTGYSIDELARIEAAFEKNTKIHHSEYNSHTPAEIKEDQFNGLEAVIKVLCEIEGIPNILDFTKLFEVDEKLQPVHELTF